MFRSGDILVAEDSRLLLQLLHDALLAHRLGSRVVAASRGDALLSEARQRIEAGEPIGLYLLDIVMPGLSGLDTAYALRALEQQHGAGHAPILLYSSLEPSDEIRAVIEACWPARYIHKTPGARADRLALEVIDVLQSSMGDRPPDSRGQSC